MKEKQKTIRKTVHKTLFASLLAGTFMLSGCQTPAIYYDDWYNPPVHWGQHTVKEGETLYRIAWRYGRDYRELGNANGLQHPYKIQEGQAIRLDLKGQIPVNDNSVASAPQKSSSGVVVYVDDLETNKSVPVKKDKPKPTVAKINVPQVANNLTWVWPHNGEVIRSFEGSSMRHKGIDIAGSKGDPVKAAADGHVMYAGSGILGYGNMIILGHDAKTFSVYAHNDALKVSEGDLVTSGQTIAHMGDTSADRVKLYFEIRKDGSSVSPSTYLAKR